MGKVLRGVKLEIWDWTEDTNVSLKGVYVSAILEVLEQKLTRKFDSIIYFDLLRNKRY